MIPDPNETEKVAGFQLDVSPSPPRSTKQNKQQRKKTAWVVWGSVCAVLGIVVALVGIGSRMLPDDAGSLTILPISDPVIRQGDVLRMPIPIRREGPGRAPVTYRLGDAPTGATIDETTGDFSWPTAETHQPGTYPVIVRVLTAGRRPVHDELKFSVVLLKKSPQAPPKPATEEFDSGLPAMGSFVNPLEQANPFEIEAALTPQGKIDEFVFDKLKQLNIEPAKLCSDGAFVRRVYLDTIGTLPTADEAKRFLDDKAPDKRTVLIDRLLERPEFADYWAMKWSDLLRVKAEFPINLWPNAAQAYHRWIRTSLKENLPYDRFVRELLTACGSNFRTPQVNFYRALQSKDPPAIAQAVALAFMGVRAETWPKERWAGMGVFFSQIGYKPTREWKEEIVVFDPHAAKPPTDGQPPAAVFPDGTKAELPPARDPREVFADWLIDAKNPWFARHIVNRVWYWLQGRGIVHEPDDIRPNNPAQNVELLNWLADELVQAKYDLKHVYRLILNSTTYQLSCIPKSKGPEAAANFACYPLRRLDAEVLVDALCQITGTTESYSSMIPEPFTFIPEKQRSIMLPDGSITSSVLEMFGRPPRDTGLESERNNRMTAAQALHLLNSSHIRQKIQKGPKLQEVLTSTDPQQMAETLYLAILSRRPTNEERDDVGWQCDSKWGAENLVWALFNSEEFLFRH
jgi:hypothetical protein